jgi:hypothetical protein
MSTLLTGQEPDVLHDIMYGRISARLLLYLKADTYNRMVTVYRYGVPVTYVLRGKQEQELRE